MKNYKEGKQKGLVLLTGMIFILIVSTGVVASYQNISSYAFGRAYEIEYIKRFYGLEEQLEKIEHNLINLSVIDSELATILDNQHILDSRNETQSKLPEELWINHAEFVQEVNDMEYIIEYMGKSSLSNNATSFDMSESKQDSYSWTFRIHIKAKQAQEYTMQSIVHVYPVDALKQLDTKKTGLISRRVAWFDYTFGE